MFLPFFTFLIISFDAQVFNLDEVQELKDYSFPIKWSGTLIENQLARDTWVSFWILFPLVSMSLLMPQPHYLINLALKALTSEHISSSTFSFPKLP